MPQRPLHRVGDGDNAPPGAVRAVLPFQPPAQGTGGNGRLGGRAGLRDNGNGKIPVVQDAAQFIPLPGAQAVSGIKNLGISLRAPADVPVLALQQLDGRPRPQGRTANANHHHRL